jgi:hypothetical protein
MTTRLVVPEPLVALCGPGLVVMERMPGDIWDPSVFPNATVGEGGGTMSRDERDIVSYLRLPVIE